MPELVNSIVGRFYKFLDNHIHAGRYNMSLPLTISVLDHRSKPPVLDRSPAMTGYLRDISKTGLSLIVPTIRVGNYSLINGYFSLRILVELPTGPLNIEAAPVRFDKLDQRQAEGKYLIGARIMQISESDRKSLTQYLQGLKKGRPVVPEASFAHDAKSF